MRLLLAARLSAKQADGKDGLGLETQDEGARKWAEENGHEIVSVAADTKSGTVAPWDRKNLRPWVTMPEKLALYDGVLAFKTDRLSRGDQEDFTRIEGWATLHGKALVIANGPMYPARDDSDYWMWTAEKRTARREWENIRERSMRAQRKIRETGGLVGKPPWGYEPAGERYSRTIVPTAAGRQYVPQIYGKVIAGDSLRDVARWLNDEGVPSGYGGCWWPRSVMSMIRCPTYKGRREDAAGRLLLRCEALVDADVWKRAGKALSDAARGQRGPAKAETRAMLRDAIFCPRCPGRSPMYRIGRAPTLYYRCSGRGPDRKGCGLMVPLALADSAVDEVVTAQLDMPVMTLVTVPGTDHAAELEEVQDDLQQLMLSALDADADSLMAKLAELRARRDELAARPAEPDRTEWVESGQTYADAWKATPVPQRGGWLAAHGFSVTATRDRIVVRSDDPNCPDAEWRPGEVTIDPVAIWEGRSRIAQSVPGLGQGAVRQYSAPRP